MKSAISTADRLVISPCCNPQEPSERLFPAYAELGYSAMEAFTSWCAAALDWRQDAAALRDRAAAHGLRWTSLHLPVIGADAATGIADAIAAARFAAALGVEVVLVKAQTLAQHLACDGAVVAAVCDLGLVPVVQNHRGSAIETMDHVATVLDGVGDDRLGVLLEVGHYHSVGQHWLPAWERDRARIALVHIKDQIGPRSVPYGTGEVDLPGLFSRLSTDGYTGRFVVELELEDRSLAHTTPHLRAARNHCLKLLGDRP
jgi:sugar phosphate isomerase/epimerase